MRMRLCMCVCVRVQVMKEDDANWPAPDRVGRQELEVVMGNEHISFATTKLGSLLQVLLRRPRRRRRLWLLSLLYLQYSSKYLIPITHQHPTPPHPT